MNNEENSIDTNELETFSGKIEQVKTEVSKIIVGQEKVIELLLIAIFCRGHAIMVGVPGIGKTLLVNTMSNVMGLHFNRIQFTPDLLPSDIVGTEIIQEHAETGHKELTFVNGPVFTNMLLADEINRTPPKTQAALLEAMQERKVTYGGKSMKLATPFFVLATQNPIEQEGTYNLPEAQLDRFFFMLDVGYPSSAEEHEIINRFTRKYTATPELAITAEEIIKLQSLVEDVLVREDIIEYVLRLVRATRVSEDHAAPFCRDYLSWGAGPRASMCLILGAKAHALLCGRSYVNTDDVVAVAEPVLAHRIIVNYAAISEGVSTANVIERLLEVIDRPADVAS